MGQASGGRGGYGMPGGLQSRNGVRLSMLLERGVGLSAHRLFGLAPGIPSNTGLPGLTRNAICW